MGWLSNGPIPDPHVFPNLLNLGGWDVEKSPFEIAAKRLEITIRVNKKLISIHERATELAQPDPNVPQTEGP